MISIIVGTTVTTNSIAPIIADIPIIIIVKCDEKRKPQRHTSLYGALTQPAMVLECSKNLYSYTILKVILAPRPRERVFIAILDIAA